MQTSWESLTRDKRKGCHSNGHHVATVKGSSPSPGARYCIIVLLGMRDLGRRPRVAPLISTKLDAMRRAMRALERLEFMATENVMNWQMSTTEWNSTSARVTARSAPSCARCHLSAQVLV